MTGVALCDGGDERELTVHNLQEYVHLLSQLWLADGVHAQAMAFRDGIEDVFPVSALSPFTLLELQTLLCGTMSIKWSEAELQRHLHPSGGYTKHSKVGGRDPRRVAHQRSVVGAWRTEVEHASA